LFDPFRGSQRQTGRTEGLGLGLYIVQQIVLAHGGSVDVQSGNGNHTAFVVRIPASALEARQHVGEAVYLGDSVVVHERTRTAPVSLANPRRFINRGAYMCPSRIPMPARDAASVTSCGNTPGMLKETVGTRSAIRASVSMPVDLRLVVFQHAQQLQGRLRS